MKMKKISKNVFVLIIISLLVVASLGYFGIIPFSVLSVDDIELVSSGPILSGKVLHVSFTSNQTLNESFIGMLSASAISNSLTYFPCVKYPDSNILFINFLE